MAIQTLRGRPGLGELFGTGLGAGISQGVDTLVKQRQQNLERNKIFSSLVNANVPENVAQAVATAPVSMRRSILYNLMALNKPSEKVPVQSPQQQQIMQPQQQAPVKKDINILGKLRSKILSEMKKGRTIKQEDLLQLGVDPGDIEALLSETLNDNIINYFLSKTNKNPKKARQLARKFGYKV